MRLAALLALAAAAAVTVTALVTGTDAHPVRGRTFYVSPSGNDRASGRAGRPWRTVARVDRARLRPGDTVLFRAGARYRGELTPLVDRTTFASYGAGRATIDGGVWFSGVDGIVLRDLAVTGAAAGIASSEHAPSTRVTVEGCLITRVGIGINSANAGDAGWTVSHTTISHTGNSGAILIGHDLTFDHDRIVDTGESRSVTYPMHGVYAKGPGLTFTHDVIRGFQTDGLSLRYRDADVEHDTIEDGQIGIAWFQDDTHAGTTTIADNTIAHTTDAGIYVSPADAAGHTRESFVVRENRVLPARGVAVDVAATTGRLRLDRNQFSGRVLAP